jgi:hypothetical protein
MGNSPHNSLPAVMHMHMLDRHRLLSLAAVPVERGDGVRVGATFKFVFGLA